MKRVLIFIAIAHVALTIAVYYALEKHLHSMTLRMIYHGMPCPPETSCQ